MTQCDGIRRGIGIGDQGCVDNRLLGRFRGLPYGAAVAGGLGQRPDARE